MSNDQSLMDRIESPEFSEIPEVAMKKIDIIQKQFYLAEVEQLRHSHKLMAPLIAKRSEIINIPEVQSEFWMRVFASAPPEIDEYILPSDASILGGLKNMTVERFELDAEGNGEPRSLRFTFEFKTGEENPFFTNEKLIKEFYWRQEVSKSPSGRTRRWEGLVSDPVRINWKKDMDLTKGLLDAACDLAEAEKKKGGDSKKLPEYATLVNKIQQAEDEAEAEAAKAEDNDDDDDEEMMPSSVGVSFFGFFGYRGRNVSAAKSQESAKEIEAHWAKVQNGEASDSEDDDDEDDDELEYPEIFPDGEDLAESIAEDLWPDALKYYVQSYQIPADLEGLEMLDEMDEDDEDEDEESESRPRKKARN